MAENDEDLKGIEREKRKNNNLDNQANSINLTDAGNTNDSYIKKFLVKVLIAIIAAVTSALAMYLLTTCPQNNFTLERDVCVEIQAYLAKTEDSNLDSEKEAAQALLRKCKSPPSISSKKTYFCRTKIQAEWEPCNDYTTTFYASSSDQTSREVRLCGCRRAGETTWTSASNGVEISRCIVDLGKRKWQNASVEYIFRSTELYLGENSSGHKRIDEEVINGYAYGL